MVACRKRRESHSKHAQGARRRARPLISTTSVRAGQMYGRYSRVDDDRLEREMMERQPSMPIDSGRPGKSAPASMAVFKGASGAVGSPRDQGCARGGRRARGSERASALGGGARGWGRVRARPRQRLCGGASTEAIVGTPHSPQHERPFLPGGATKGSAFGR